MTKEQFVGTWQLVCSEFRCSDGTVIYPYGQDASGNLYYDAAGNMAVQLMRSDRPLFAAGDRQQGTPEEIKAAFEGYLAYFGHYEVDEQEKIVIHHVASCTFPNWIDQPQKRFFAFADNQLTLSTPPLRVGDQLSLVYCVGNAYYDDSRPRYAASRQVTCQDPQ